MKTEYLTVLAAAAATGVSAGNVQRVDVVHIFETLHVGNHVPSFSHNKRDLNAIFARDSKDEKCLSTATSILRNFPTPTGDLSNWVVALDTKTDECTLTAPSSLSSDLMKYYTALADWEMDNQKNLVDFIKECATQDQLDDINKELGGGSCSDAALLFTGASATETVMVKTALPNWTPAPAPTEVNAAAAPGISQLAALAAAGVAGFMIAA
ncbi:uncharacterized protein B0J16DRAFT_335808 [Fusarium flagelliforme]|uniref:Infection structure specific protein n=1 Tax=Fusarium flagelliforme TaxID=2675880 RepID=A0A395MK79_9HYPO|nr:uncharacterized protein B0J16DRAFT_335808 [Fusarium flagelliforme]KAH7193693.1 hypothetical protein B0J16DRAFT_335808 [Fusarium flagelliforme]RFN48271.1 infection structure specific protein [Fusarium flagelliforme]